jgi:hypothetical protein
MIQVKRVYELAFAKADKSLNCRTYCVASKVCRKAMLKLDLYPAVSAFLLQIARHLK